jgi:hypothetical protein
MSTSVTWNSSLNPPVLSWVAPATRTDGSAIALADITEFDIFYATGAAAPISYQRISGPFNFAQIDLVTDVSKFSVPGTYTFTVFTKDTSGNISASSNSVSVVVVATPPAPISTLSVAINT